MSTAVIAPKDASTVENYCRYVRHLELKDVEKPLTIYKIMLLLHQFRHTYKVFPILLTLTAAVDKFMPCALAMLGLSLSRSLPTVTLYGINRDNQADVSKFIKIHSGYPQTKGNTLTLKGTYDIDILRPLKGPTVETLIMDAPIDAPQDVLSVMSAMTGLRGLSILHNDETVLESSASSRPDDRFLNGLSQLTIAGHAGQIFAYLDNMVGMEMLSSLCLQFALPMRDPEQKATDFTLQERCILFAANGAPSVETLEISDNEGMIGPFEWNALVHINKCKSLKHLDVKLYRAALGVRAARSRRPWYFKKWASLETLRVQVYHWGARVAPPFRDFLDFQLSPVDLRDIAECCPALRSLRITIPFPLSADVLATMKRALPAAAVQRRTRQQPAHAHGLKELTVCVFTRTYVDDPVPLDAEAKEPHGTVFGRYLNLVFPQLENVSFVAVEPEGGDEPHPFSLQWCEALEAMTDVDEHRQHAD